MCPCHPQAAVMVAMIFFAEMPEWQWHYDHAMDSLYLTVTSRVCLYIFFQLAFAVPVFSLLFDPAALFLGVLLYMAHPGPVPPHQAHPPFVAPQYVPQESSESDPSKMMDSSSSSSLAPDNGYTPSDPGSASLMANGFLSLESA